MTRRRFVSPAGVALVLGAALVSLGAALKVAEPAVPVLRLSTYHPTTARDPFQSAQAQAPAALAVPAGQAEFRLQGLLLDGSRPAALINNQLVVLNKPVNLLTSRGPVEVKAIEINRRRILLEVGGEKIELPVAAASGAGP